MSAIFRLFNIFLQFSVDIMWGLLSRIRGLTIKLPKIRSSQGDSIQRNLQLKTKNLDHWNADGTENQTAFLKCAPKLTVCIEGNIGSGKSTLLNYFSRFREVEVVPECVDKWRNLNGSNLFNLMYQDPNRWSYAFQTYVQLTMIENHMQSTSAPVKLMERSVHSARYCFVENLYRSGKLSSPEYSVYDAWYKKLTEVFDCRPDLIVYLRTDPRLVYERSRSRARTEETELPLEYFCQLHDLYEEWFGQETFALPCPVLVMEANGDLATMYKQYGEYARKIAANEDFLGSLIYD